jgi:uncharacterized protein (DUF58 family)
MRPRLHHMSICAEGVCYLVIMAFILAASLIRQMNLLMILYGVLTGPLLLSWPLVRRQLKRVDVTRHAPKTVVAGEPFSVDVEIANGRRGASFGLAVRDELERRGREGTPNVAVDVYCGYVPGQSSRRTTYAGKLPRRGVYQFLPMKLSSRFPLGLLRTMVRLDKPQKLLVLPRLGKLSPVWKRMLRAEEGTASGARRTTGLDDGDFYGLRDWRPGDPRNRIHWRTSARRQSLTVRQYERRRQSELLLIVDLWEPPKAAEADRARTDSVASFAATVLAEACRDGGQHVRLELLAKRPRQLHGSASSPLLEEAWQMLAAADAASNDALPASLVESLGDLRSHVNVVIVSTREVDLRDRSRFAPLYQQPNLQPWLARIVPLTPGDAAWGEVFREVPA